MDFITEGNLPFNVAQLPSLQDLLETVCGRKILMPSRHKFMATLESRFNEMKSTLREILSKQKYLCVTADVWSSRAQSYLGITVHFLDEMFVRNSYLLALKSLRGAKHTPNWPWQSMRFSLIMVSRKIKSQTSLQTVAALSAKCLKCLVLVSIPQS